MKSSLEIDRRKKIIIMEMTAAHKVLKHCWILIENVELSEFW